MKNVQFLSNSSQIDKIIKGLNLTRSLYVSSLLLGEAHTGKKSLIKMLFPNSIYVDARDEVQLTTALNSNRELIIYNFEYLKSLDRLNFENRRIIAISNAPKSLKRLQKFFAFIYKMPTLKQREDLPLLIEHFKHEIMESLMVKGPIELELKGLDLSQNSKSLKASLYRKILFNSVNKEEIQLLLYNFFYKNLEGNNAYREHLKLYEEPLIQAGLKKYKSQLKLSSVLGLNRNTLRKKIQEYGLH